MSDPIDISKLPTFMLREIVAGETKPQPEEVMPGDTTRPDNAAPQGSEPPAGAAGWRPIQTAPNNARIEIQWPDGATAFVRWDDGTWRDDDGCRYTARDDLSWRTPPPQPPGGTPEEAPRHRVHVYGWGVGEHRIVLSSDVEIVERQRNEARAALAAALAEVEALRKAFDDAAAANRTYREQAAELEQTRRERDALQQGAGNAIRLLAETSQALTAAEQELAAIETGTLVKLLRERLTAAEQRADGAERHDEQMNVALGKLAPKGTWLCEVLENIWRAPSQDEAVKIAEAAAPEVKAGGLWSGPRVRENLEEAERQRDTAIRERDDWKERHAAAQQNHEECLDTCQELYGELETLRWLPDVSIYLKEGSQFAALFPEVEHWDSILDFGELIIKARRERDVARKDTARLNWMEKNCFKAEGHINGAYEHEWHVERQQGSETYVGEDIRAAIDAALAAKTTEGGV